MIREDRRDEDAREERRRAAHQLSALEDVAHAQIRLDSARFAQFAVQRAAEVLDVPVAALHWWNERESVLRLLADVSAPGAPRFTEIRPGEGASGLAFVRRDVTIVHDYATWEHRLRPDIEGSALAVPIVVDERVAGTMYVRSPSPREFSPEDVRILTLIAAQAGPSIEAGRLYAQLSEQSRLYETVLEAISSMNEALVLTDGGRVVYANRAFQNITGIPAAALSPDRSLYDLIPPEHRDSVIARSRARGAGSDRFETEIVRADGERRVVQVATSTIRHDPDTGRRMMLVLARDVTERKRTETLIRESEERYRRIVETAQEGIWTIDAAGVTTFVNPKMAELVGYAPDEMVGRPMWDFMDDDARRLASENVERRRTGIAEAQEFRLRRRDGSDLWTMMVTSPLEDPDGTYRGALAMVSDITERRQLQLAIEHHGLHDQLTSLPNRVLLRDRLDQALVARVPAEPVAVAIVALDHFRDVNELVGHAGGDEVLRQVARRLRSAVQPADTVGRLGGDEFAVILAGRNSSAAIAEIEDVIQAVAAALVVNGRPVHVSASAGVAVAPDHARDPADVLRRADLALREARTRGVRAAVYSGAMDRGQSDRLSLAAELRAAISDDQLQLHYQPKVDSRSRKVVGVEALVRWEHPTRGMVPTSEFLATADRHGLMRALTRSVLRTAVRQCSAWRAIGYETSVAVNLDASSLQAEDLPEAIAAVLEAHHLPATALTLEITEGTAMADPGRTVRTLTELRDLGVGIAIDDFGTGHSSLAYLQHLPVTELKVDRTFVAGMLGNEANAIIARAAIDLAHNLRLTVVAEGVEDEQTWVWLRTFGCDIVQGFRLGQAMPLIDVVRWLESSEFAVPVGHTGRRGHAERIRELLRSGPRGWEPARQPSSQPDEVPLALAWAVDHGDADLALDLAHGSRFYWLDSGQVAIGRGLTRAALGIAGGTDEKRALALNALGMLAGQQGDHASARVALLEAIDLAREHIAVRGASLSNLGVVLTALGDFAGAREAHQASLRIRRAQQDSRGVAICLNNLALNALREGDLHAASAYARDAVHGYREAGDRSGLAAALDTLGAIAHERGLVAGAIAAYEEALTLHACAPTTDASQPIVGAAVLAAQYVPLTSLTLLAAARRDRSQRPSLPSAMEVRAAAAEVELESRIPEETVLAARAEAIELSRAQTIALALKAIAAARREAAVRTG